MQGVLSVAKVTASDTHCHQLQTPMPDKTSARQGVCKFALRIYPQCIANSSFNIFLSNTFYHHLPFSL